MAPEPARPLLARLAQAFIAVIATASVALVLVRIQQPYWDRWLTRLVTLIAIAYVGCGAFMLLSRRQRFHGSLMVAFGILFSIQELGTLGRPQWVTTLIILSNPLSSICLGIVLLRYPERHFARSYERSFVVWASAWGVGSAILLSVLWPIIWANLDYSIWPSWLPYDVETRARTVVNYGFIAIYFGFAVLLALRIARTRGLDRRVYIPTHIASACAGAVLVAAAIDAVRGAIRPRDTYFVALCLVLLAIPILLAISELQRRLQKLRVATLVTALNTVNTPQEIQTALRSTFADPTLLLLYWSAERSDYVDANGDAANLRQAADRIPVDLPRRDGSPLARVVMDRSAAHYHELLEATKAAGGLAVENAALQASLMATIDQIKESQQEGEALSRLLPTGLADILRRDGLRIGESKRLVVTVLMSDVRDYSAIAEHNDPSSLATQLNIHRREMNRAIISHSGTVMQYVGDAVMAVFGTPAPSRNHADDALAAALAMHEAQERINEMWFHEGLPRFGLGIGLSTGDVAAALLGSDERVEYTVVGDVVNLANRLQGLARPAGSTVISEATWLQLTSPPSEYEFLAGQLAKGRLGLVTCYRIGALHGRGIEEHTGHDFSQT